MSTKQLRREATRVRRRLGVSYTPSDAHRSKAFWVEMARDIAETLVEDGEATREEADRYVAEQEARPVESFCQGRFDGKPFTWTEEHERLYRELEVIMETWGEKNASR